MIIITLLLIFFYFCVLVKKYQTYGVSLVQYPIFWLASLFVFYGIIPVLFYNFSGYSHPLLKLSDLSNDIANVFSLYTAFVFIAFFSMFRCNVKIINNIAIDKTVVKLLIVISIILFSYFSFIVVSNANILISYSDRISKFMYFNNVVLAEHNKLYLLALLEGIFVCIISIHKSNMKYFFLLFPLFILDYLIAGRRFSILIFVPIIIASSVIYPKQLMRLIPFIFLLGICSGLFREDINLSNINDVLITSFGEFNSTRDVVGLTYQKALYHSNLWTLLSNFIFSLFPGAIFSWVYEVRSFTLSIKDFYFIGEGRGLSGNIVAESLYYGGSIFAVISPLIIGFIYKIVSERYIIFGPYGIIFSVLLSTKTIWIMRSEFYVEFANVLMTYFVYILPLFLLTFLLRKI